MRTETRTVRIGEWLGPVDPAYATKQHEWGPNRGGTNPELCERGFAMIQKMAAEPKGWRYSPCDFTSFEVVEIGMYDGWPYWKPTPAIGYLGPLGGVEVAFFYSLDEHNTFRRVTP